MAGVALASAVIAGLGVDGGLVWLVAGVFTARAMAGVPLGAAWGIAVVGCGIRWGTLGLADLEVATRLAGTTLTAGPPVVRIGMGLAFAAALAGEVAAAGTRSPVPVVRIAGLTAIVALVPLFVLPGPDRPLGAQGLWWGLAAAAVTAFVLGATRVTSARAVVVAPLLRYAPVTAATGVALALAGP